MAQRLPDGLRLLEPLEPGDTVLLQLAQAAAANSYSPYSKFATGAGVRTASGRTHHGCNIESASFFSICAERTAIAAARAAEGEGMRITDLLIWSAAATCPPCGTCRQSISELCPDARVIFPYEGRLAAIRGEDLLPVSFRLNPRGG